MLYIFQTLNNITVSFYYFFQHAIIKNFFNKSTNYVFFFNFHYKQTEEMFVYKKKEILLFAKTGHKKYIVKAKKVIVSI